MEDSLKGIDYFRVLKQKYVQFFLEHIRTLGLKIQIEHFSVEDLSPDKITWRQYSKILGELKDVMEHDAEQEKREIWHPATLGFVMRPGLEMPFEDLPPDDSSEMVRTRESGREREEARRGKRGEDKRESRKISSAIKHHLHRF